MTAGALTQMKRGLGKIKSFGDSNYGIENKLIEGI
jgi:hypothetical protein